MYINIISKYSKYFINFNFIYRYFNQFFSDKDLFILQRNVSFIYKSKHVATSRD